MAKYDFVPIATTREIIEHIEAQSIFDTTRNLMALKTVPLPYQTATTLATELWRAMDSTLSKGTSAPRVDQVTQVSDAIKQLTPEDLQTVLSALVQSGIEGAKQQTRQLPVLHLLRNPPKRPINLYPTRYPKHQAFLNH